MYPVHNLDILKDGNNEFIHRGEIDGTTTIALNPYNGFLLGKRKRSPKQRREQIVNKRLKGEDLTLDEKRSEEAEAIKSVLKKH